MRPVGAAAERPVRSYDRPMHVTGLFVYPVKGCGAVALDRAVVGRYGLDGDRLWMIVDASGRFVTQRTHPELARVRPRPVSDGDGAAGTGGLVIEAPDRPPLRVARPPVADRDAEVWGQAVRAADAGEEAAEWFSAILGVEARLVAVAPGYERPVNPRRDRWGREVHLADAYPLLLCSEASLAELNRLASEPFPMERFRPNLVVAGDGEELAPWAEDGWAELAVGEDARFDVVSSCARCTVPNVDQQTGERHREPGLVLAAHRQVDRKTYFGRNLVHATIGAQVAVGDRVTVVA
jgi:uncharacterized protein YcbX